MNYYTKLIINILFFCIIYPNVSYSDTGTKYNYNNIFVSSTNFTNKDGINADLSKYNNKVTLINFWATWCKPCVEEMPALSNLQKKLKQHDIHIVPISLDFTPDQATKFYKDNNIELPLIFDLKQKSFKAAKVSALPTSIIYDTNGNEVERILGAIDWESDNVMEYLLKLK